MGSGCSAHSSVHVQQPQSNTRHRALHLHKKPVATEEQIKKRKNLIFHSDSLESSFMELTSPKSGKSIPWRKGDLIGEGAYAKVYQCINLQTGELLAVKSFTLGDDPRHIEKEFENMKKEVSLLRNLNHTNIVQYYQTDMSKDLYTIDVLLEFVPGGSLKSILHKYRALEIDIIRSFSRQILKGLDYLHNKKIVHRDLKSANILISFNGVVKLTDFGSSIRFDDNCGTLSKSLKGSPYWMAPEVVRREGHSFSADIWSFGCVMIEMVTGEPPWSNYSRETKQVLAIIAKEGSLPDVPKTDEQVAEVIMACINRNPTCRPNIEQLLEMRFFKDAEINRLSD